MGLPMATLLVQAGHDVRGVEINPSVIIAAEAVGITVYPSAAQAAAGADAVVTMLATGDHVREMLLGPKGLFAQASEHTVFIDSSTIGVECAKELHAVAGRLHRGIEVAADIHVYPRHDVHSPHVRTGVADTA